MSATPYPPEVQAVLDAAQAVSDIWNSAANYDRLRDAVDAYRKSITPPEPFVAEWVMMDGEHPARYALAEAYKNDWGDVPPDRQIWRGTFTPQERVK